MTKTEYRESSEMKQPDTNKLRKAIRSHKFVFPLKKISENFFDPKSLGKNLTSMCHKDIVLDESHKKSSVLDDSNKKDSSHASDAKLNKRDSSDSVEGEEPEQSSGVKDRSTEERLAEQEICQICLAGKVTSIFRDCFHSGVCNDCVKGLKDMISTDDADGKYLLRCPFCNTKVSCILHYKRFKDGVYFIEKKEFYEKEQEGGCCSENLTTSPDNSPNNN